MIGEIIEFETLGNAVVLAVSHERYKNLRLKTNSNIVFDIKSVLDKTDGRL